MSVVNGASLKGKTGVEKSLLVKADEKTRARLDEYEKTRVLSEVSLNSFGSYRLCLAQTDRGKVSIDRVIRI